MSTRRKRPSAPDAVAPAPASAGGCAPTRTVSSGRDPAVQVPDEAIVRAVSYCKRTRHLSLFFTDGHAKQTEPGAAAGGGASARQDHFDARGWSRVREDPCGDEPGGLDAVVAADARLGGATGHFY